jgi:hypothetical protein
MQSAEDFMREFFRERTADIQKELERRKPFRDRYFTSDCRYDSRVGNVERSQSETIENASQDGVTALVVTRQDSIVGRLRYHLRQADQRWLIEGVNMECTLCKGTNSECVFCHGTGWRESSKEQLEKIQQLRNQTHCKIPPKADRLGPLRKFVNKFFLR